MVNLKSALSGSKSAPYQAKSALSLGGVIWYMVNLKSAHPRAKSALNSLLDAEIYQFIGTLKGCLATLEFNLYLATNYIFWSRKTTSTPA